MADKTRGTATRTVVATQDLLIDGAVPAFRRGDTVPVEHVERYGWGDLVAGESTKAAAQAREGGPASTPATAATTQD